MYTPHLNLVLQSSTTPGQFDMWQNADVPQSGAPPPPVITPSGTEPYYTSMQMYQNANIPRSDVPLVIDLSVP